MLQCVSIFVLIGDVFLGWILDMGLLVSKVSTCVILLGITKVPSRMDVQICVPISNVYECLFPYILSSRMFCYIKKISSSLIDEKWYLSIVLTCISLIMSEFDHFLYVGDHFNLFFLNRLFMSFSCFLSDFGFFPFVFKTLYIRDINLLWHML